MSRVTALNRAKGFFLRASSVAAVAILTSIASSAQNLEWVITSSGSTASSIAVDAHGNSYVLEPRNSGNFFAVAKYATNGSLLWSKTTSNSHAVGVAVDSSNDAYALSSIGEAGAATFGLGESDETTITGFFGDNVVAKYAIDGRLIWVTKVLQQVRFGGAAIASDTTGNIYVAGSTGEAFVEKYASNGALLWSTHARGLSGAMGIAVDLQGNSYLTGLIFKEEPATFGFGEPNQTTLTSSGEWDIFLTKYASGGTLLWAKAVGTPGFDVVRAIAVDRQGGAYVTGTFNNVFFLAKYAADGAVVWTKLGRGRQTESFGIAVDGELNSYVSGGFRTIETFGGGESHETTLTSAGDSDIFLAKFAANGDLVWAQRAGGPSTDSGFGIGVDNQHNAYVAGYFSDIATFGFSEANQVTLRSAGSPQLFVAKYRTIGLQIILKPSIALWPPNHKYITLTTADMVAAIANGGNTFGINDVVIDSSSSDEPEDIVGDADGSTLQDIQFTASCRSVQLRSERDDTKNGRVYSIKLRMSDNVGNVARAVFKVAVPIGRKGIGAIEDAAAYTVPSLCN